jgi:hypothetical protein
MTDAPVAAVMEFKWSGDVARPVTLAFVYNLEVARSLVGEPLEEVDGRAAWLMPPANGTIGSSTPLSAIATNGIVPSSWALPTVEMILLFRPD